eukprot:TRINITY_DN512_c0_g2_i1.p1 TRINITY_DN512_c0_g2~~TRINITY_DN512_c0_g2_i1.p1  ORF type:complete len:162 (-),score=23.22 TRINITY_DN512_c0_g2_i1:73-558(-)
MDAPRTKWYDYAKSSALLDESPYGATELSKKGMADIILKYIRDKSKPPGTKLWFLHATFKRKGSVGILASDEQNADLDNKWSKLVTHLEKPASASKDVPKIHGRWVKLKEDTGVYISLVLLEEAEAKADATALRDYFVDNKFDFDLKGTWDHELSIRTYAK